MDDRYILAFDTSTPKGRCSFLYSTGTTEEETLLSGDVRISKTLLPQVKQLLSSRNLRADIDSGHRGEHRPGNFQPDCGWDSLAQKGFHWAGAARCMGFHLWKPWRRPRYWMKCARAVVCPITFSPIETPDTGNCSPGCSRYPQTRNHPQETLSPASGRMKSSPPKNSISGGWRHSARREKRRIARELRFGNFTRVNQAP